jgi:hypothetical protein
MFHQLHCLVRSPPLIAVSRHADLLKALIRSTHLHATTPRKLSGSRIASHRLTHHPAHDPHHDSEDHIAHCFDYLRQAIMCAGNTTLEHAIKGEDGKVEAEVDGWGVEHECRDFGAIFDWAGKRRSFDRTGILSTMIVH